MNTHSNPTADFDQRTFITFRLARLQNALNSQAAKLLKRHGNITLTEWRILIAISVSEMVQMADISRHSGFDKGMVSRAVKSLVRKGLVESVADAADARAQLLKVTAGGLAVKDEVLPQMMARTARMERDISPESMAHFNKVVRHLEAAAKIEF